MNIITRFAPSPTGMLHIGGARTALFNYLFAKNNGGKFLLRVEDTDKKRSTKEAIDAIFEGLKWLGIKNDGIVYQSKNIGRHQEIAQKLLESGKAYYCYTSTEELAQLRQEAEKKGEVFRFQSPWRDKQPSQNMNVKPVIRIKAPKEGETIINDIVQGEVKVANSELDDLVILRNDGTPTYMLAVVVDDHDMNITHILRGDDHLTNSFRQKIIYDAMGWEVPKFIHIPLIYGSDGAKMSKRHGATSVTEYEKMGYLPEAMRNYLLRLGWSHGNDEIISDEQAVEWFNLESIGKSPARFDFDKLKYLNKHYIKKSGEEEILEYFRKFSKRNDVNKDISDYGKLSESEKYEKVDDPNMWIDIDLSSLTQEEETRILKALKFLKLKAATLEELWEETKKYQNNLKFHYEYGGNCEGRQELINNLENVIRNIDDWNIQEIKESFSEYEINNNLEIKDYGKLLRLVLMGGNCPGGIFDIIEILGKEEVLARFKRYKDYCNYN